MYDKDKRFIVTAHTSGPKNRNRGRESRNPYHPFAARKHRDKHNP